MAVVRWLILLALGATVVFTTVRWWNQGSAAAPAQVRVFTCPMHPDVVSDRHGTCPICHMDLMETVPAPKADAATRAQRWQCPMHPQVIRDAPGSCPICHMDLVPVAGDDAPGGHPTEIPQMARIQLDARRLEQAGVRTVAASSLELGVHVAAPGLVVPAESRTVHVHARVQGWVEELLVRETGQKVKEGEPLLRLYSPEVVAARKELATARGGAEKDPLARSLVNAAEQRLRTLGVDPAEDVAARTLTMVAPRAGHVTRKGAVHGLFVTPETELFEISDLSSVWVLADVREDQLGRVKVGTPASITFTALPGQKLAGRVSYLYPAVDVLTRTTKARIELANAKGALRPGMYAQVDLAVEAAGAVVGIPADAVVDTGSVTYVMVKLSPDTFEPRRVELGARSADRVEVLRGLQLGEEVVTGALFMLDSESRLRGVLERATPAPAGSTAPPAHNHGGH